jgi:hypothetical protein
MRVIGRYPLGDAAMACVTFLLTTSLVFTTPGITQITWTGFPIISTLLEQSMAKGETDKGALVRHLRSAAKTYIDYA